MTKFLLALSAIIALGLTAAAYGAECYTVFDMTTRAKANGVPFKIVSGSALADFEATVKLHGQNVPDGATRALTVIHGGVTVYGFEVAGCLTGPFELNGVGA